MGIAKRYDRMVWTFFFIQIVQSIEWSIMVPFLAMYLKTSFNVSASTIGSLYLITGMVGIFSAPVGGELCDRYSRKIILIIGGTVSVLGNIILAVMAMTNPTFYTFIILYITRSIFGEWAMIAISTMLADVASSHKRLEVYGLMGAGQNTGFAVGSLLGGFLAMSSSIIFSISAVLTIPPLLIAILFVRESKPKVAGEVSSSGFLQFFRNIAAVMRNKVAIAFLGILTIVGLIFGQFYGLFPIYCEKFVGISSTEMGIAYSLEGITMAIFSYFVSRWATKFNLITVYGIGVGLFSLAALGVGVVPSLIGILVFYSVVEAFAEMFCTPTQTTIMATLAPESQRGIYLGVLSLFHRTHDSYAPFIGGILMDILAPQFLIFWCIFSTVGLLSLGLCFLLKKIAKGTLK